MASPTHPARLTSDRPTITVEVFDAWAQSQTGDTIYEFIAGEVVEVPSNAYAPLIASYISYLLQQFIIPRGLGWITGEGGGYQVNGERYAPDVAFVRSERQRRPVREGYNPVPPDLAVEIISADTAREQELLRHKVINYLSAGAVVMIINSVRESVELHVPSLPPFLGDATSCVTFAEMLSGFTLDLQAVFAYACDQLAN